MSAEEQAVQILNSVKLAGNAPEKVALLKSLQEVVVKRDPSLVPTFVPEVLELQVDPAPAVRRALLDFFDAAMQARPGPSTLVCGMRCIQGLARDDVAATAKRAVASAYPTFRSALAVAVVAGEAGGQATPEVREMWKEAEALKAAVVGMVAGGEGPAGVRLAAAKFMEQAAMLLTADKIPAVSGVLEAPRPVPFHGAIVSKADLVREGEALVSTVTALLKGAVEQPEGGGPLSITCFRAAMALVQQRPQFLGRVMPALLAAARSGVWTGEAASSPAGDALKAALKAAHDSRHPMAKAWKKKVADALSTLGAAPAAAVAAPAPQQDDRQRAGKRSREEDGAEAPPAAKQRASPVAEAPAPAPAPTGAAPADTATTIAAMRELDTKIRGLLDAQDAAGVAELVGSLSATALADFVLLYLPNLPPRGHIPPDSHPHPEWLDALAASLWPGLATAAAAAAPAPGPPRDPRLAAPAGPSGAAAAQQAARLPPMPIPEDVLAPVELSETQRAAQRRAAVVRILKTQKTSAHALRTALVARLTTAAPDSDRTADAVLEHLFEDFHERGGMAVAVSWLYLLFTELAGNIGGSDGETPSLEDALPGSRYEDVLLSILEGLKERLPPSDRSIAVLLSEAPALPGARVQEFLTSLTDAGGEWATLALVTARDVALTRPPARTAALSVALQASVSADADVRTKAVRLLANRLFPEATMTAAIEDFAREQLAAAAAVVPAAVEAAEAEEEVAAKMEEGGEDAGVVKEEEEVEKADGGEAEMEDATGAAEAAAAAAAAAAEALAAADAAAEAEASRKCALYCALCTKKHSLLRGLFEQFGGATPAARAAILANAPGLAKTLGPTAPALLVVVQSPPADSLDLVLAVLGVLTSGGPAPPSPLVAACLQLFNACKDPRILAPALPGMDRASVLRLLPSALELPPETLKPVIARLVTSPAPPTEGAPPTPPLFSPAEFLAALHTVDAGGDAGVIRRAMAAIHLCVTSPELFPPESLAAAINQLLTRNQLPPLFMRTVIQSLAAAPRLRTFVVGVLGQLAAKQVWNDATQWRGWVLAAQQTAPDSFPALLALPPSALEAALKGLPADLKTQLGAYAASPQCTMALSAQVKALLDIS